MSINRKFFFDQIRGSLFGGAIKPTQVVGLTAILDRWEVEHWNKDDRWLAYAFGTDYHETDKTMQPIREYGRGKGKAYGKADPQTHQIYYGRGLVQLTWYENYKKMADVFGIDFVNNPDLVMEPANAVKIMFYGMENGTFTGKKFADFFNETKDDPVNARRIINRLDKARIVADYYAKFYSAISYTN